jgi:hypothetical protein
MAAQRLQRTEPRIMRFSGVFVREQTDKEISQAVKDCLTCCYAGGTPLGVIAECVRKLRDNGWPEADVRTVESTVRKVLAGLVSDDNQGSDA